MIRKAFLALLFTLSTFLVAFILAFFFVWGDCAEDVITHTHIGPCVDAQRFYANIILFGWGLALLSGNWLIFRKRRR